MPIYTYFVRLLMSKSITIWAVGMYAKQKKVHLLTRNVQTAAYKQLNIWYDLSRASITAAIILAHSGHRICKESHVMLGQTS